MGCKIPTLSVCQLLNLDQIHYSHVFLDAENEYEYGFLISQYLNKKISKLWPKISNLLMKYSFNQIQNPEVILYAKNRYEVIFSFMCV